MTCDRRSIYLGGCYCTYNVTVYTIYALLIYDMSYDMRQLIRYTISQQKQFLKMTTLEQIESSIQQAEDSIKESKQSIQELETKINQSTDAIEKTELRLEKKQLNDRLNLLHERLNELIKAKFSKPAVGNAGESTSSNSLLALHI